MVYCSVRDPLLGDRRLFTVCIVLVYQDVEPMLPEIVYVSEVHLQTSSTVGCPVFAGRPIRNYMQTSCLVMATIA